MVVGGPRRDEVPVDDFVLPGVNQTHGIVVRNDSVSDADIARRFPVGTRLRFLPNHACAIGTQFSEYHAVAANSTQRTWRYFDGW
jgi:D-serine deaminase-like pyridoxal phosphate-dependent protein